MKNRIIVFDYIKYIASLLLVLFVGNISVAQNRSPQNIRRVTNTFYYFLENGKRTDKVWPLYQELFDSLGRCHTEIVWSLIDNYPHNYYWNAFNGKLKVKAEFFLNEKLSTIEEFAYNKDSLLSIRTLKKVNQNDTSLYLTISYIYDSNSNPIQISAKSNIGKTAFISKSTFDNKGKELTRKVKIKKNFSPQDSIIKLLCIPFYDSIGRLASEELTIKKVDKITTKRVIKYSYDINNNLIGILTFDEKGKQVSREVREYMYSKNRLSLINRYDSNDVLVNFITKRYEIYRTNDRRVREIEY